MTSGSWLMAAMMVVGFQVEFRAGLRHRARRPDASGSPSSMRMQRMPTATSVFLQNFHRRGQELDLDALFQRAFDLRLDGRHFGDACGGRAW